MTDLEVVLETLRAHYVFDARGRLSAATSGGVPPRFVLGRAAEGCIWRFRADLEPQNVVRLARLAAREPGAVFDGDLPAPPERLTPLQHLLSRPIVGSAAPTPVDVRRTLVTRGGVVVGELWSID